MKKSDLFWQSYLNLEKEILNVSKYIYVTDEKQYYKDGKVVTESCKNQLDVFSPYIADLLVKICVDIEAISKELYFDLGGKKKRGDKELYFDEDCLKLIDIKYKTHKKIVMITCTQFNLTKEENLIFKPLREAHKRMGVDWNRAYQAVKHDRYYSIGYANMKVLIHAMGALYLLNLYFRNIKVQTKYLDTFKVDYSFGSSIFSVKKPKENYVVDVINNCKVEGTMTSEDSPFILKYTDNVYKSVLYENDAMQKKIMEYFNNQPEMKEENFIKRLIESKEREKVDKHWRMIPLWELCQYRINKKIPSSLPFEDRKKLFIKCSEWNGCIRKNNNPKNEDEITEENIQQEIDLAGTFAGIELQNFFEKQKTDIAFNNGYCEIVLDNGTIKYNL